MTFRLGRLVEADLTAAGFTVTNRTGTHIRTNAPRELVYAVVQDNRAALGLPLWADYETWEAARR